MTCLVKLGEIGDCMDRGRKWRDSATAERERVARVIRRDQVDRALEDARRIAERELQKRRDETDLEWKSRMALLEQVNARALGPIVPPEAEQHAAYADVTVELIDGNSGLRTRAVTKRRQHFSALEKMRNDHGITDEQWVSAMELAEVGELFRKAVSPGCTSLEARVDNSSRSGGDLLEERMNAVRLQRAYTLWRQRLPMPRQLVLDMIHTDHRLFAIARRYGKSWPVARKLLCAALDRWPDIKDRVWREIGESEAKAVYFRLGEGRLLD